MNTLEPKVQLAFWSRSTSQYTEDISQTITICTHRVILQEGNHEIYRCTQRAHSSSWRCYESSAALRRQCDEGRSAR